MIRSTCRIAVVGLLVCVPGAHAAPGVGVLDRPFGDDGISVLTGATMDQVYDATVDAAGRTLVLGNDSTVRALTRRGRVDRGWGGGGYAPPLFGDLNQQEALTLIPRPDGGTLVVGGDVGGTPAVARLTVAGRQDAAFGTRGPWSSAGGGIARMDLPFPTSPVATRAVDDQAVYAGAAAGSLLVVAAFSTVSGRPHRSFGQDGLLGVSTRLAASPFSALWPSGSQLTLARDGRFTLLGPAVDTRITGERQPLRIVRFTKAGTTTTATVPFRAASVLHDGAGFVAVDGPRLLRLKDDGTPQPPAVTLPGVTAISAARRAADGSLMLAGLVQRSQPRRNRLFVARLTPAGALDRRFWSGGLRLLSFPRAQIGQRLGALLGPVGPGGLVTAVGTSGDGGNDIREDLGPTYLAALRLRTAAPTVGLRSTVARVDPRGRSTLVVRCRAATAAACPTATIIVRHGGRRLGRAVAVAPPPRQDVRVPVALGPTGRRIAGRRGRVVVEVSAGGDAVRAEVTLRRR